MNLAAVVVWRPCQPGFVDAHLRRLKVTARVDLLATVDSTNSEAERRLAVGQEAPFAVLAQAQGGTPAEFAMAFTMDANRSLTITLHEVYLALAKTPIEGPAGVEASFDFRAAFNATAGRMMTVVLRNQQVGTEYG